MTQARNDAGQQGRGDQASAKVHDAASVAQEKASELREQGSAQLRDQLDQRSRQAGAQTRSFAETLRRTGSDLQRDGNSGGRLAVEAADRIERLGGYLEQRSGDELMRDIETFARRRPWMLAGLGMLAGIAGARFMKASSEQRHSAYRREEWPSRSPSAAGGYAAAGLPAGGRSAGRGRHHRRRRAGRVERRSARSRHLPPFAVVGDGLETQRQPQRRAA